MGTNYYLHEHICSACGRGDEPLHIGKSSAGWCFSLAVYDDGPKSLDEWIQRWSAPGVVIRDEYGRVVSPGEMLACVADRSRAEPSKWSASDYVRNGAQPGPRNLVRHALDGSRVVGHGEGTWDYLRPGFS